MPLTLDLPLWHDLHAHFRQGPAVASYLADHLAMGCAGVLAMPNTKPPVSRILGKEEEGSWSLESYRQQLLAAGADRFERLIVPLYLTADTTPEMIAEGSACGLLEACKYYPPHGTTNSEHGVALRTWIGSDVLHAMEEADVVLCLHGEEHGLAGADYFDRDANAESRFYEETLPDLHQRHPRLRLVCEHITTAAAVRFVESAAGRVGATVTPQHLLFTVGHLLQGFRYHLYCLPLVKFEADRAALRDAVARPGQTRFFAGTDSAPHAEKVTPCGCAAGCYTGGCAPQLYAAAFEESGVDLASTEGLAAFERFLCLNGPAFYGFAPSEERFRLAKDEAGSPPEAPCAEGVVPLPRGIGYPLRWSLAR